MRSRPTLVGLAVACSLVGCSSAETGSGGAGASGGVASDACAIDELCSPGSCPVVADELMELESLREQGARHTNREVAFCDGILVRSTEWPRCLFECDQCDQVDRFYDTSGALVGYSSCTDNDIEPLECSSDFCVVYGDTDPPCDGEWTTEGPCFGVPCLECGDDRDVCDDDNDCTEDVCCFGACKNTPYRDGRPCEGGECVDGACTS